MAKGLSKELKQPDEFVSFWTHLGAKIAEKRKLVIGLMVGIVVAGGVGWGVTAFRRSQAAKATAAFARIDKIANAALLPDKTDDKAGDKAAKDDASKAEAEDPGVPRFKTAKERLDAAIREADSFIAQFGQAGLGRKALFGKAGRLILVGQPAEAATIYESLAASETDGDLKLVQEEGAAAAYEAAGKLDDALRLYSMMADDAQRSGTFYLDRSLYAKARVLEKQGKGKDAEKILREILDKVPKTLLRSQIDDRLAVLAET